jgi:cell wall-associated NlpC family hydrolase
LVTCISACTHSQDFQVFFDDDAATTQTLHIRTVHPAAPADTIRLKIVEKAREYLGVNYKWGQSDENGFDCSGYVKFIFAQFGYLLPHSSYEQYNTSRRLSEDTAKPGDLVFFITRGGRISHVGIYLGDNHFIHAPSRGKQVRIESLDTDFFKKNLAGFGTLF